MPQFIEKRNSTKLTSVEMTEQEEYEWERLKKLCAKTQTDMWELLHLAENAAFTGHWENFYDNVYKQQTLERQKRAGNGSTKSVPKPEISLVPCLACGH